MQDMAEKGCSSSYILHLVFDFFFVSNKVNILILYIICLMLFPPSIFGFTETQHTNISTECNVCSRGL